MANPYSLIHDYNKVPLYSHQFDLLATSLQAKEQGLAAGRDAVQQAYDQVANLDIYKDVDKEYAQNRLAETMSFTDKYSKMDLSDPNLAMSITKNLGQVLDENVMNAISSTKIFKAEQAEWNEKRTKDPKLYNEANHRYAMRSAEQWLKSDQVGATYGGGGGFIEYVDYKGKLTETMMKVAKEMGYEYIETTPGNGIFREQVTKRVIDRGEMQAVLKGAIDPKMQQQMQIDAWDKYNQMPDEVIQAAYTQEQDKEISTYQNEKAKIEGLRNTSTNPAQIEAYDRYLAQLEQGLTSLNQSSYEKVGKQGAYTSLFTKELEDNYLDAYSRAPYEIKREVNELDEATANYQMKVAEFELSKDKFSYQQEQDVIKNNLAAQRIEIQKANLALKTKADGAIPGMKTITNAFDEALNIVENTPMEKENTMSEVEWIQSQEKSAYNSFRKMFGDKISQEDMNSPELITALRKGGEGQDKITVKLNSGKKVTFDLTNKYVSTVLDRYTGLVLNDAPVQKRAYASVNEQAEKVKSNLVKNATNLGIIPEYKIIGTEDNFKIVPVDFEKVGRDNFDNFSSLLYKKQAGKKLTWAEEKTLDLYVKTSMYYDKSTSSDAKAVIKKSIEKEILWKSENKKTFDYVSSKVRQNGISSDRNPGLDVQNHWTRGAAVSDVDLEAFSKSLEADFKKSRGTINYNQTKQVIVVDQKTNPKTWSKVEEIFPGKLEKDYEINIIPNNYANGIPTGTSRLVVTDKEGEIVDKGDIELSDEQFFSLTGKKQQVKRDNYDASFGEFAQTINLGNGSVQSVIDADAKENTSRYNRLQAVMYQSPSGALVPYVSYDFKNQATKDFQDRYGMGELAFNMISALEEGKTYNFKLESVGGTYAVGVYKNGQRVFTKDAGASSFNAEEIAELKSSSQAISRQAFLDYMKAEALKTAVKQ